MKNAKLISYTVALAIMVILMLPVNAGVNTVKVNVHTPDGYDQVVHPDIYYNESGVFGYEYWMVITPYPSDDDIYENPCLYASHNGFDWITPDGVTNPLVSDPDGRGVMFNSDPDLVFVPDEMKFYIYYAENHPAVCTELITYDGTTFSEKQNLTSVFGKGSSQAIIYTNDTFYLYFVNQADQDEFGSTGYAHPYLMTSTNGVNFTGNTRILLNTIPSTLEMWHMNAELLPNGHLRWLLSIGNANTTVLNATGYLGESVNFTAPITIQPTPIVSLTSGDWDSGLIYRSCSISDGTGFDCYYSCDTTDTIWSLMYARIENVGGTYQIVTPARPVSEVTEDETREFDIVASDKLVLTHSYQNSILDHIDASVTPIYTETSPYEIPTSGLVAFYKMDEGSGTTLIDSSGNGLNGTYANVTFVDGKYNGAVRFNGVNSSAVVSNFPNMTNATVLVTVRNVNIYGATGTTRNIVGTVNYAADGGWALGANASLGKVAFSVNSSAYTLQTGIPNFANNDEYTQLGMTYANSNVIGLYQDNKRIKYIINKSFTNMTGGTLTIGKGGTYHSDIVIDNIIIYNRTLSNAEMNQIYYDNVQETTVSSGYSASGAFSGVASFIVPIASTGSTSRFTGDTPDSVVIGGVTVHEYSETISPFTTVISYTGAISLSDATRENASDTWITSLGLIGIIVLIHFVSRLIQTIRGSITNEGGNGGINWLMADLMLLLVIIVTMGTLTYVLDSIHF